MTFLKQLCIYALLIFTGCQMSDVPKPYYDSSSWPDSVINAYSSLMAEKDLGTANKLFNAAELMPVKNWEIYLLSATIYANYQEHEKAFLAVNKSIDAGFRDTELLLNLPDFEPLHSYSRWASLVDAVETARDSYLQSIKEPDILKQLEIMWASDQKALANYEQQIGALGTAATIEDHNRLFKEVTNVWDDNKTKLTTIIGLHGWPGNALVGEDGAKISWAIAQHHPDVFFKKKCLALIKKAVEQNLSSPNYYAELYDRIARDTWSKQKYGSSMGQKTPHPILDASEVNKRRHELGLAEPAEVYAIYHGIKYSVPSIEQAKLLDEASYKKAQKLYSSFEKLISEEQIDSALIDIRKAIEYYGDLSNQQLFDAALSLSKIQQRKTIRLSSQILKVLVWREWENRKMILKDEHVVFFEKHEDWNEIRELVGQS